MRPTMDETWLDVADDLARRSTCLRRAVGCVLADMRGRVLSTGYNGVAPGQPHCNELVRIGTHFEDVGGGVSIPRRMKDAYPHACPGATAPSGTSLDACQAIHAEQNALVWCRAPYEVYTCYVTHSPCVSCVKLLLATPCRRVVFHTPYAHDVAARALFVGRPGNPEWVHLPKST